MSKAFDSEEFLEGNKEMVKIIEGVQNLIPLHISCASLTQKGMDIITDSNGPRMFCNTPEAMKTYAETLGRGVTIRIITEITRDNLSFVKEGMHYVSDLRHMDGISHSFTVMDKHYISTKVQYESPYITQTIFSNVGWFVKEHQYLFEILWNKAIPAKQRMKEIEEGVKRDFIEILRDPLEIVELVPKVIKSAYEEILVLFPTLNTFTKLESEGIIQLIENQVVANNVRARFLFKDDKNMQSGWLKKSLKQNMDAYFSDSELLYGIKMILIIVDGEKILTIEIKDDLLPALIDSIGLATYSNNASTVVPHASMFERIWIQSEMAEKHTAAT